MNAVAKPTVEEADARLSGLPDRVERGEEVTISRSGRAVADLAPARPDPARIGTPRDGIWKRREEIKAGSGPITTDEILELIGEGRKY